MSVSMLLMDNDFEMYFYPLVLLFVLFQFQIWVCLIYLLIFVSSLNRSLRDGTYLFDMKQSGPLAYLLIGKSVWSPIANHIINLFSWTLFLLRGTWYLAPWLLNLQSTRLFKICNFLPRYCCMVFPPLADFYDARIEEVYSDRFRIDTWLTASV